MSNKDNYSVGEDGLLEPSTPLRAEIARLTYEGKHYKEVAEELGCHPDTVRKSLKDADVKAHMVRLRIQRGEQIDKLKVRDWRDFAPAVQQFYEHILTRAMNEPEYVKIVIGTASDGSAITADEPNRVALHFQKLAAQIAPRIEDRVWGKTPQKMEIDKVPTAERLEELTDAQLDHYRRAIISGVDKNVAFAQAIRIEDADYEFEPFEGFIRDAEILAIEAPREEQ